MVHKYEILKSAKILCGSCDNVWIVPLQFAAVLSINCPNCDTTLDAIKVDHIIKQ